MIAGDYLVTEARGGGWKARHRRHGTEVTALLDGRVALVVWPSAEAVLADIEATYRDPGPPVCGVDAD